MIDASHLQSFSHFNSTGSCEINLVDCKSLKILILHYTTITDDWLGNHVPKLLLLENLTLRSCGFLKEIKICHQQLRSFKCFIVTNLWRPRLKAPMLISFNYSLYLGAFFLVIILLCWSWAHAKLQLFGIPLTSDEWFMILKNFLASFGCCKIFSLISFGDVFRF